MDDQKPCPPEHQSDVGTADSSYILVKEQFIAPNEVQLLKLLNKPKLPRHMKSVPKVTMKKLVKSKAGEKKWKSVDDVRYCYRTNKLPILEKVTRMKVDMFGSHLKASDFFWSGHYEGVAA